MSRPYPNHQVRAYYDNTRSMQMIQSWLDWPEFLDRGSEIPSRPSRDFETVESHGLPKTIIRPRTGLSDRPVQALPLPITEQRRQIQLAQPSTSEAYAPTHSLAQSPLPFPKTSKERFFQRFSRPPEPSQLPTSDSQLPTTDSQLPTTDSQLPTTDSQLPTSDGLFQATSPHSSMPVGPQNHEGDGDHLVSDLTSGSLFSDSMPASSSQAVGRAHLKRSAVTVLKEASKLPRYDTPTALQTLTPTRRRVGGGRTLRNQPQVAPNYDEACNEASQMFETIGHNSIEDVNELLGLNEMRSVAMRAIQYGVAEDQIRQWDADRDERSDDEDAGEDDRWLQRIEGHRRPLGRMGDTYESQTINAALEEASNTNELALNNVRRISTRDEEMETILASLGRGWKSAIDKLVQIEIRCSNLPEYRQAATKEYVYHILISLEPDILQSHIRGDLAERYMDHREVRKEVNKLRDRVKVTGQPAIYRNALVDAHGRSPTPRQLLQVLDTVEQYPRQSNGEVVAQIDSFRAPKSTLQQARAGVRKYLTKNSRMEDPRPSLQRQQRLLLFCKRLRERLALVADADMDRPLRAPLIEVGYSGNVLTRLASHKSHTSSNFIMNLFEAACAYHFPGQFTLHQHIIFLIFAPIQAILAEVILTRLGQGYISNAGGFSSHPAGQSNNSVKNFPDKAYEVWQEWNYDNTPFRKNHDTYYRQWLEENDTIDSDAVVESTEANEADPRGSRDASGNGRPPDLVAGLAVSTGDALVKIVHRMRAMRG